MDFYSKRNFWYRLLLGAGVLVVGLTLLYTRHLAKILTKQEAQTAQLFGWAQSSLADVGQDTSTLFYCDVTAQLQFVANNKTIPVILLDERGRVIGYKNIGAPDEADTTGTLEPDTAFARRFLRSWVSAGISDTIPIETQDYKNYVVYSKSPVLRLLTWYPIIMLALISAFVAFAYFVFLATKKAEQNRVWVGMAKETAHQLGTPISGIVGWSENLKLIHDGDAATQEMLTELDKDIHRLGLVAERFSKIGAAPVLAPTAIWPVLEKGAAYMKRRSPRKVEWSLASRLASPTTEVPLNAQLFDWVLENLLRNAIDALENGQGAISIDLFEEGKTIVIDISDTGKGIPRDKWKSVFRPGFSTKTRGWGLGLSLAKRIVEEYHGGKIFVKKSALGEGTTFQIRLPK